VPACKFSELEAARLRAGGKAGSQSRSRLKTNRYLVDILIRTGLQKRDAPCWLKSQPSRSTTPDVGKRHRATSSEGKRTREDRDAAVHSAAGLGGARG
jgi:hypothetical protein